MMIITTMMTTHQQRNASYKGCLSCGIGDMKDGICNNPKCPTNKIARIEGSANTIQATSYYDNTTCPVCHQTFQATNIQVIIVEDDSFSHEGFYKQLIGSVFMLP